jgi:hypothetical protein
MASSSGGACLAPRQYLSNPQSVERLKKICVDAGFKDTDTFAPLYRADGAHSRRNTAFASETGADTRASRDAARPGTMVVPRSCLQTRGEPN